MEATSSLSLDEGPLWKYVSKLEKGSWFGKGGNSTFKCIYCDMVFMGSYSRVRTHLLKVSGDGIRVCSKVPVEHKLKMQKLHDEIEKIKMEKGKKKIKNVNCPDPCLSIGLFPHTRNENGVLLVLFMQCWMVRRGRWVWILLWKKHSKMLLEQN